MALVKCRECGATISEFGTCPTCGYPQGETARQQAVEEANRKLRLVRTICTPIYILGATGGILLPGLTPGQRIAMLVIAAIAFLIGVSAKIGGFGK